MATGNNYVKLANHTTNIVYYAQDTTSSSPALYGCLQPGDTTIIWPSNTVDYSSPLSSAPAWQYVPLFYSGTNNEELDFQMYHTGALWSVAPIVFVPPTVTAPFDQSGYIVAATVLEQADNEALTAWFVGGFGIGFACAVSGLIWNTLAKGVRNQGGFHE